MEYKEIKIKRENDPRTVQPQIFKRDDWTCQICGERGCALHVDHIKPWAEYPELRFEVSNCRTLCIPCHYKVTFDRELEEGIVWCNYTYVKEAV